MTLFIEQVVLGRHKLIIFLTSNNTLHITKSNKTLQNFHIITNITFFFLTNDYILRISCGKFISFQVESKAHFVLKEKRNV